MVNNKSNLAIFMTLGILLTTNAQESINQSEPLLQAVDESTIDSEEWQQKLDKRLFDLKQLIDKNENKKSSNKIILSLNESSEDKYLPQSAASDSDVNLYRLNIGDQLRIMVYGKESLNRIVSIDNYGKINVNYINTIQAAGKTIPELQQDITERLEEYFKHINVLISPHQMRSQHFTIAGSINLPGRKPLATKMTLLSAISQAGGLQNTREGLATIPITDLERSFIIRGNHRLPLSFDRLVLNGDMSQDIELNSGDFIYLSFSSTKKITILGQVNSPQEFQLRTRTTLLQLMSHVQGRTPNADDNLLIIRGSLSEPKVLEINFADIIAGEIKDVYLQAGDIVFVPERDFIFGEQLVLGAINTFVQRIASEAGTETFRQIEPDLEDNDNDFIFNGQ